MNSTELVRTQFFKGARYLESMQIQDQVIKSLPAAGFTFLGFDYQPVITVGKRGVSESEWLDTKGFDFVETDRGGQATLHSPGQLVIYPIFNLRRKQLSVRDYVLILETTTREWLRSHGIETLVEKPCDNESGVFTSVGKIAFIGLRIEGGITKHGMSINLANDLQLFEKISACGVRRRPVDSVKNHGVSVTLENSFKEWTALFLTKVRI